MMPVLADWQDKKGAFSPFFIGAHFTLREHRHTG